MSARRLFLLFGIFYLINIHTSTGQIEYQELKAVLMLKLVQHINWPNEADIDTYKIGVLGKDTTTYGVIKQLQLSNKIKGKPFKVIKVNSLAEVKNIHILVTDKSENPLIESIWHAIENKNILLITEQCPDGKSIMINILLDVASKSISYQVNKANIVIENLGIEPELLLFGGTEVDIRELYREIKEQLASERLHVKKQNDTIEAQLAKIKAYNDQLENLRTDIEMMTSTEEELKLELQKLSEEIDNQKNTAFEKSDQILEQEQELRQQRIKLNMQNENLAVRDEQIARQIIELDSLLKEKDRQSMIISSHEETININESLIQTQRNFLYLLIAFAILGVVLVATVYIGYKEKKRANQNLESKVLERTKDLNAANESLMLEIEERKKSEENLRVSEGRYAALFESSPVSIWEEDFSEVIEKLKSIEMEEGMDKSLYFDLNPSLLEECLSLIKVIDVNNETVKLHRAESKESLLSALNSTFTEKSYLAFKDELVAIWNGDQQHEMETVLKTVSGEPIDVIIRWSALPGYEQSYGRVMLTTINVTELKQAKNELEAYKNDLELLIKQRTEDLMAANEELSATNDELYSKNEIINRQNEELKIAFQNLKEAQTQLIQTEKMASLGVLTAGVAHEINNPLNFIMGGYNWMESYFTNHNLKDEIAVTMLNSIKTGVDRAASIVRGLNQFSRSRESFDENCDIHTIIENCLLMVNNQIKGRIEVVRNYTKDSFRIIGNVGKLHQVFVNILTNSSQAITGKGQISIGTSLNSRYIIVVIEDTGEGISKENLDKIADPFFTTKPPGEGTGLGLSITYTIIKEHKGDIKFESERDKGTTVTIKLPLS